MKSKKALALALVCALALSVLAGCTSGQQPSDTPGTSNDPGTNTNEPVDNPNLVPAEGTSEETLKVACDGEPTSIFPNYVTNKTSTRVDSCLFDTLVRWNDETKTAEPSLATKWEQIDDLHWQFTLRDDVYFTNGEKLTANDVIASLQASYD